MKRGIGGVSVFIWVTIAATFFFYKVQAQDCVDLIPQDSESTCLQHAKWGRCTSFEVITNGYCQKSCGYCQQTEDNNQQGQTGFEVPSGLLVEDNSNYTCFDVPPDSYYTCMEQKAWGKCGAWWMKQNFCRVACGQCIPSSNQDEGVCNNVPPDNSYTCYEQKEFGKCEDNWMYERGFCKQTCGRCDLNVGSQSPQEFPTAKSAIDTQFQQCSIMELFQSHPIVKEHTSAYNFFKAAIEKQSSQELKNTLEEKGFEGVLLLPTNAAVDKYFANLNDTALVESAKFHVVPGELNRNTIGPYEITLQGGSVLLIKDELAENELRSSGAPVQSTLEMFRDPQCRGQELDIWVIESMLFPPNVVPPSRVRPTPQSQQSPDSQTSATSSSPTSKTSSDSPETFNIEDLLLIDDEYSEYYQSVLAPYD
eukprot:TRINITY_DN1685_c0_g1_i10.p2 TRINITY_DN1685_c0_g1~~TRINITY_DN1685_c0_g1_i10.p2  ORF type:complete len:422 (+),score=33.68 TRINITY_DN1685_c0_g1_i10:209-1474(+)